MSDLSAIEELCRRLARLPGLGPRSARRAALALLEQSDNQLLPLIEALQRASAAVVLCDICGNIDETQPCHLCRSHRRDHHRLCVVERVSDLWALERTQHFNGCYHVLGGVLSPLQGIGPQQLRLQSLIDRVLHDRVDEVILATSPSVEGQVTAQYIVDVLKPHGVHLTRLGQGVPVGGDFDYLDEATLKAALSSRQEITAS